MASVASGAYVISSNRAGKSKPNLPEFGGVGLAYAPGGNRIDNTGKECSLKTVQIDLALSNKAQSEYPCYLNY